VRLNVEILPCGRRVRLLETFVMFIYRDLVLIPAGFETDFASVPRFFWRIVPPWGKYSPAAVVHDFLYATGVVSRRRADKIFLRAMCQLDVAWWRRQLMYRAVRAFGWIPWNNHRRKGYNNAEIHDKH
jgi:hypothetical protein